MRAALLCLAAPAAAAALLFARPHPTPGPPMRDFEAYYAAGAAWNAGSDPYSQAIWIAERPLAGVSAHRYEALPFVGPPAMLPFLGVIARLPFATANVIWRAALMLAFAGLALLTLRLRGRSASGTALCAIAVAAVGFGPLTSALALGQLALPAFAFAVLALTWPPAAVLAWVQPNLALTLLPAIFSRTGRIAFILGAAVFAAACFLVSGIPGVAHYAAVLHAHASAERFSAIQLTPAAIAYGFGAAPQVASALGITVALAAIGWWVLLMRSLRGLTERFCATCALLPFAVPFFHEHDLLVLFVPGVIYATRATGAAWLAAAAGACFTAIDWLGLAQRPDGTLQTLLLAGAFAAAILVLGERPRIWMLALPAAVLVCVAGAAFFAGGHPAPVWPDAMGLLPHGIANFTIAAAWEAQQRANGLFAQSGVWAALRALSLLGCALTAGAITLSLKSPADSRSPSPVPA